MGFLGGASGKEPTCQCRRCKRRRFDSRVGKIPWRKVWQPTPSILVWEGRKESDTTEQLSIHARQKEDP